MANKWGSWKLKLLGFVECTLPHNKVMNFQNHNVLFIQWSCWKLTSTSLQEIQKKIHSTYEIIINNEGSGSRVNQAEKFKANQQRNSEQSAQTFKVSWQKKKSNQHKWIQTILSKCYRTPIEGCNPRKILKWTKKSNTDLMISLTEENSAKQYQ